MNFQKFHEFSRKIVAIGRNYRDHAKELGNPVPAEPFIFIKPSTAYITEGSPIKIPKGSSELHHEVELGVVIGKKCKSISEADVFKHIAGYTLALDMTERSLQEKLKQQRKPWTLAKGFDTSCPVGPFIDPSTHNFDPTKCRLWLKVNGNMKQDGSTSDMIFDIPQMIRFISETITLEPGDLVLTGTPAGVGPVKNGDVIEAGIDEVTSITFNVEL